MRPLILAFVVASNLTTPAVPARAAQARVTVFEGFYHPG